MDTTKKIITLKHHMHDYECMWNGIEDLYISKTNEVLPENLFFLLSAFGTMCYRKTPKSHLKRMIALGDGRTKQMYKFLSPIVGFEYKHHSFDSFATMLEKAKKEIRLGNPVVLGALDMFYLPYYEKIYHKEHIPFHYILMVGYDDEANCIYLYDCGRIELLTLSYAELSNAMNCSYPELSKANTLCTIRMYSSKNKYQIAQEALAIKKELFLNPPTNFLGYKGFERFIQELPTLKTELGKVEYDKILLNMVTFLGAVPNVPNAIKGISEPDMVPYKGSFDKMGAMLLTLGNEYGYTPWISAASFFDEAGFIIEKIANIVIAYLIHSKDETSKLPELFFDVLTLMKQGYATLV